MALWAKKSGDDDQAGAEPPNEADTPEPDRSVGELAATLDRLGSALGETNRRVVDYLAKREVESGKLEEDTVRRLAEKIEAVGARLETLTAPGDAARAGPIAAPGAASATQPALSDALKPLEQRLAQIEAAVAAREGYIEQHTGFDQTLSDGMGRLLQRIDQQEQSLTGSLGHVWQRLDDGLREITALLQPAGEEPAETSTSNQQWQQALLGPELASQPELHGLREQFMAEMLRGDDGAQALAGQLLVFQSSPMERMAQLLRDVGEAYYRWRPKLRPGAALMEQTLAAWLEAKCDEAGIGNRIELVDPGERFDATRHSASSRGVEITEVLGWIVLRDNGRVYTKATVAVR